VAALSRRVKPRVPDLSQALRNPSHWFQQDTIDNLGRINAAITKITDDWPAARPFFRASFASIVRSASKATSQQGRLFLDTATAISDPRPVFTARALRNATALATLKTSASRKPKLLDARAMQYPELLDLIIVHPPYFNSYKYSSVFSLELAWLDITPKEVRRNEIREGFKQGSKARVEDYIVDLTAVLSNVGNYLNPCGKLAVMAGDSILCGEYVPVIKLLSLSMAKAGFKVIRLAIRPPRFTEASWVASQRRESAQLGAALSDFIIIFEKS
jgi:hypothetical protein